MAKGPRLYECNMRISVAVLPLTMLFIFLNVSPYTTISESKETNLIQSQSQDGDMIVKKSRSATPLHSKTLSGDGFVRKILRFAALLDTI